MNNIERLHSEDILKLVRSESNISDEDRTIMYVIAKFIGDEIFDTSLKGAYSLYINSLYHFGCNKARKTIDADFHTKLNENIEYSLYNWANGCGFKIVKLKTTKNSNIKFIITSPTIDKDLKKIGETTELQVDLKVDDKESVNGVSSPKEIITNKFNLKLTILDRRLKDLIDFIINIDSYHPDGISKADLLDMVYDYNKSSLSEVATYENMVDCIRQAEKFDFVSLSSISKKECVIWFFNLINGLLDRGIPNSFVFIRGDWYPPR